MNKRSVIFTILLFLSHFLLIGCSEDDSATSAIHNEENCQSNTIACSFNSSNKAITSFSLNGTNGKITGSNISVVMPHSTDLTSLIATFTTSGKSVKIGTAEQVSGQTSNDFSKGAVIYTVFAADNSFTSYSVHSTVAIILSSEKEITSFSINEIEGTIFNSSITLTVPYGTNLTRLAPNFSASPGAKVFVGTSEQTSGTTQQNFSNGRTITYTVVAEDGSTQNYSVSVSKEPWPLSSEKEITFFSINGIEGTIFNSSITLTVPYGTNLTRLAPSFSASPGAKVFVGTSEQTSGRTQQNFSNGRTITYTVVAEDGSTQNYSVSVSKEEQPLSSEKEITFFSINGIEGTIFNSSITLTVPYGTNLTRLAPSFSASPGAKVFVGTSEQTSGRTQQNFSNGRTITYTVVAEDGSTQNYSVSVSKEDPPLSSEKDITSLSLSENRLELFIFLKPYTAVGVISEYEINFNIKAFAPAYITNMKITNMQVSPKASVYVGSSAVSNGTTLNFTSGNKTFTVKAEDGSTKNYTVKLNCNLILFGLCKRW